MTRDEIRRANTLAMFAWVSTNAERAGRFTRLLMLLHYGQNFSIEKTPVFAVEPHTTEYYLYLTEEGEVVNQWYTALPKANYRKIKILLEEWRFERSDLVITMRAAFLPEIGEHGVALLDSACPTIHFTSRKTDWREQCQKQG